MRDALRSDIFHRRYRMLRALVISLLFLVAGTVSAAEITVFAASSLTEALQEIGRTWERRTGERVLFNFGASSTLARQIEEGAPADLFASADELRMNQLEQRGLVDRRRRVSILSNSLVVAVRAGDRRSKLSPEELATSAISSLALAEPASVPAGIYAREYLTKRGLWSRIAPKVIPTSSVRTALAALESGNVDAAIVYRTDALSSAKVRIAFEVNGPDAPQISYPFALITSGSPPSPAAARFLAYLRSDASRRLFRKYGFRTR